MPPMHLMIQYYTISKYTRPMDLARFLLLLLSLMISLSIESDSDQCLNEEIFGVNIDKSIPNELLEYSDFVYLNLEEPVTCLGYVYNITFCYLKTTLSGKLNNGNFSIWEPSANTADSYRKIPYTSSRFERQNYNCTDTSKKSIVVYENKDKGAEQLICRKRCFYEPVVVKPGYVFGFEAKSYDSGKGVIFAERLNQEIGLCVSTISTANFEENSYVQFTCDDTTNATLLLKATVYPIHCTTLIPPKNGSINSTNNSYSSTVSFSCDQYFVISTPLFLTCLENGWTTNTGQTWNGIAPSCKYTNCPDAGTLENSIRTILYSTNDSYFTNSTIIHYDCDNEYRLNGSSDIQCLEGQWSHPLPVCISITCPNPNPPLNGHFVVRQSHNHIGSFLINETVSFGCKNDYSLSDKYPLLCLSNGTWNASIPICIQDTSTIVPPLISTNTVIPSGSSTNLQGLSDNYRFLIAALLVTILVIMFGVVCVLLVLLARKRSLIKSRSVGSLNEKLLDESELNVNSPPYEVSPYSILNMPIEYCTSTPNGIAYVKRQAVPMRLSQLSNSPSSFRGSAAGLTLQYPSGTASPVIIAQHYEMSKPSLLEELEQSLKSENPYWSPANIEDELFLQLDTVQVKTISPSQLRLLEEIGSGQFATVHRGILTIDDDEHVNVAVKASKNPLLEDSEKVHFLREAAIMGQFQHSNVLRLFGVVAETPEIIKIVVEFMEKGALLSYLQDLKSKSSKEKLPLQLLSFCRQICLGMTYLSGKGYIHRDLAARNILVSENDTCKIADFGMSRDLEEETYYMVHEGAMIPVKWTAPEAIRERKYSTASDVWSYGCVLYEIWTLGCKPFKTATTVNVLRILKTGQRLSPPPGCPHKIYKLMIQTWNPNPKKRPNFNDVMLSLLDSDEDILSLPDEDISTHPNANSLGADLQAGVLMYKDLQESYLLK